MGDYFLRQAYSSHFGYVKSGMIKKIHFMKAKSYITEVYGHHITYSQMFLGT